MNPCNNCGTDQWSKFFEDKYPEWKDRGDKTQVEKFKCKICGAEGRKFTSPNGHVTHSGAMRA